MKNKKLKPKLVRHLRNAKKHLANTADEAQLQNIKESLSAAGEIASKGSDEIVMKGLDLLAKVSELATSMYGDDSLDNGLVDEFVFFLGKNVELMQEAVEGEDRVQDIESFIDSAQNDWQDYLSLFESEEESSAIDVDTEPTAGWDDPFESLDDEPVDEEDDDALDSDQIQKMLAALNNTSPNQASSESLNSSEREDDATIVDAIEPAEAAQTTPEECDEQARLELASDGDLLQAYLDDALRCLASMEQAAMKIEESPQDHETARQFCRELHTLKGASGTVGLHGLATKLHNLESSLEQLFENDSDKVDADPLFAAVDQVREVIESLQNPDADEPQEQKPAKELDQPTSETPPNSASARPTPSRKPEISNFSANDDASIRIRASQLDRLMDMLAELVVLRNRRESNVAEFNELNDELARCASRIGLIEEQSDQDADSWNDDSMRNGLNYLSEVSKDVSAVSNGLRDLQKPVIEDNQSISRFIRDFRQELMQLRRVPVSGLFSRLQRAARDAAKSENKKVRVQMEGENTGLEQEIQERLFDPLLHVVRNSVSHGVEAPESRLRVGKQENGTITLSASANAQLLIIEIRDDGGGINYDAVRRRGIEKGLITPDQRQTDAQLARLIFHPGFSTREKASEISGRGVGMDVVATAVEEMRGRIEIDSTSGEGTSIRLMIPLRTGIEHVMVFQSGSQLFALPMQSITSAKSTRTLAENVNVVSLARALSLESHSGENGSEFLMLRSSGQDRRSKLKLALAVEQLIGPEEVVVRRLPNLLHNHPLINGITLAGSGKKVLLLDTDRLIEFGLHSELSLTSETDSESSTSASDQKRVLVVDDSLTARKVLGKHLRRLGWVVIEAGDGIDAVEKLRQDSVDLVLTDLDMPRMGGLELLTEIENGNYCDAPRVVVSSRNEDKFRDQAIESGACEFLNKPINESKLSDLLKRLGFPSPA